LVDDNVLASSSTEDDSPGRLGSAPGAGLRVECRNVSSAPSPRSDLNAPLNKRALLFGLELYI
jgi:hypothetical protein